MPRITVYLPSRNHAPFVEEAIHSVLAQSGPDLELLLVDDGSDDDTPLRLRRIRDPRFRAILWSQRRGASAAANHAIRFGSGEYLAAMTSDDRFRPGKLARQAAFLDAHPGVDAVTGLAEFIDERDRPLRWHWMIGVFDSENRTPAEWLRHFFFAGNALCHPSVMWRRTAFDAVGGYDESLHQLPDLDVWVRLSLAGRAIWVLPEPLVEFRLRRGGANASAPTLAHLTACSDEYGRILRRYLCAEGIRAVTALDDGPLGRLACAEAAVVAWTDAHLRFALETVRGIDMSAAPDHVRRAIDFRARRLPGWDGRPPRLWTALPLRARAAWRRLAARARAWARTGR